MILKLQRKQSGFQAVVEDIGMNGPYATYCTVESLYFQLAGTQPRAGFSWWEAWGPARGITLV